VINGLVNLNDYLIVDYILGEESTADETFSNAEQTLVASYLRQGGRLFVSGAEVAWDLDHRGTTSDKTFIHNYLKASYSADAPGAVSGVHYSATGIQGSMLNNIGTITYDNGSHGTFNVRYPDALTPENGSENIIRYLNVSTHNYGGVSFEGLFPNGTLPGKLVYLGFPFETIYPADSRHAVMDEVLTYLLIEPSDLDFGGSILPETFELKQNYPNPFNPSTTIRFGIPYQAEVKLTIYDLKGQYIRTLLSGNMGAGWHEYIWDGTDELNHTVAGGLYLARLNSGSQHASVKMLYLK